MKLKNAITGLIISTVLLNTFAIQDVSARMVFVKDDGATDADVFVLDADDSNGNDIQLQFWQSLSKTLRWDNLNGQFTFNDKVNIEGDISLTGKVDGVDVSQLASDVASHTGSTSNPHKVNFGQVISESLNVDFDQNEAENMAIENLASAPSSPVTGQIYFNTTDHKTYIWDGTAWQDMLGAWVSGTGGTTMSALQIRRTTDMTLTAQSTWYDVTFDQTDIESNTSVIEHNNTNTERIDIKQNGLYQINYQVDSVDNSENHRLETRIRINDTTTMSGSWLVNYDYQAEHVPHSGNFIGYLDSGDYITFQAQRLSANTIVNETTVTVIKLETGLQGVQGAQGIQGETGPEGPAGDPGPSTTSDSYIIDSDDNGNPQILSFGSGLDKTLYFNRTTDVFVLTDRLNIAEDGNVDGVKLTTTASPTDSDQNQIEVKDNAGSVVFGVDEDGDMTTNQINANGNVDFNQNQALDFAFENLATAPTSPVNGQIYYNTTDQMAYLWNGSNWKEVTPESQTLSALQARRDSNFTLTNANTWYDIPFNQTDLENTPNMLEHNNTNTDNFDIKADWLYQIHYQITANDNSVNHQLNSRVRLNDTSTLSGSTLSNHNASNEYTPTSATFLVELSAGDYITLQAERLTANTIINETSLSILKLEGGQGEQGVQGEKGDKGDAGDPWPSTESDSFIIDSNDDGNPQILSFGSSLNKTLSFDVTNDWFNLSDRLNIGGSGNLDGIKLTTTASATDSDQNQIEIRNNSNIAVFGVDEDGDLTTNGQIQTSGGINSSGNLDLNQNELQNTALHKLSTAPTTPTQGQIYFNTNDNQTYIWDGSVWQNIFPEETEAETMKALQSRRTSDFTLSALNTWYDISLDTTDIETNTGAIMHDDTNTDNIRIYEDGVYRITYHIDSNDTGVTHELHSRMRVNNTSTLSGSLLINRDYRNEHIPSSASFLAQLSANDFITLQAQRTTANTVVNETTVTVVKMEATQGATGAQGIQGIQGEKGDKGDDGTVADGTDYDVFKIDQDNSSNTQILSFGSGTTTTFSYDVLNNRFEINDDLLVNGDITSTQGHTKYLSLDIDGGIFTSVERGTIAGGRSPVVRLDPDDWSRLRYSFPVPDDWVSGTDIIVEAYWTPSNTNVGNIAWRFEHASIGVGDVVDSSAFTTNNLTQATPWVDSQLSSTNNLFTISNTSITNDEMINFRLNRNGADASDTFTGNVNIQMLRIKYTGKKVL